MTSRRDMMSVCLGLSLTSVSLAAALGGCDEKQPEPTKDTAPVAEFPPARAPRAPKMAAPVQPGAIPAPADVAHAPADAVKEKSGLTTKVLQAGQGKNHPGPNDSVKVSYTGWSADGRMFDSSTVHGGPVEFGVSDVIKGWTEALQLMVAGEKRRLWIPAGLAYGAHPGMGQPAGDLTFDVELLEIEKAAEPPPVPADLTKPPADAKKTKSGLIYRFLAHGKGKRHPSETDRVRVHYSGWTKDGKMFDSSVVHGKPIVFPLNRVIKGWTEGVQLMVEGDKCRFWIPADLAYGEKPARQGAPAGDLVFDVELLGIE